MRISDWSSDVCSSDLESLTDELEPLILRQRDRAAVALALQRGSRVFNIGLHQLADALVDRHQGPGALRVVVHKDVVALLRVCPEVEDLRHRGDVLFGALPALIGVDREAARCHAVVAAQVEHRLVVAHARRARGQLVLGEVEPGVALRLAGAEEDRRRSEEHTSELQSLKRSSYAVFCLKKKKRQNTKKDIQV